MCITRLFSIYGYLYGVEQDLSQRDSATIPAPPVNQPLQSGLVDLKITDLLKFFHQYEASYSHLQMTSALIKISLSFNDIELSSSLGLSAKVDFSLRSSEALVEYMLVSRTASAEVS